MGAVIALAVLIIALGALTIIGRGPIAWWISKEGWFPHEYPWPDKKLGPKGEAYLRLHHWVVDYHLIYDGGSQRFHQYYFTKLGAHFSMFWQTQISSWGGTAKLRRNEHA